MPTNNEILREIDERLRDDIDAEGQFALAAILGSEPVTLTLPLHEWAALVTALEELEPLMEQVSPNGTMRRDVMAVVAKINAFMEAADDDLDPAPILAQLEAGGFLKPKGA